MELYSENGSYKLYHGNMLDLLEVIESGTIDSIVTDPPYELNFMGKGWDNSGIAFQKETWEKCLEALKPGGYLLAFGGSRTYHRIACAIEDAGFEIRDCIMWLYGCYSEDTEVLTDSGYKLFKDIDKDNDRVLQWDSETNKLSWFKPTNFFEYDIDDELVNFKNRNTDQLITKNHRVYGIYKDSRKPKGDKYEVRYAGDIKKTTQIDLPLSGIMDGDITIKYPYLVGWWLTDAWKHKDGKACMFSQSKPQTLDKLRNYLNKCGAEYSEYIKESKNPKHRNEHTFYVHGEIAEYLLSNYNDRELKRWMLDLTKEDKIKLLEGLMDGDGTQGEGRGYSKVFWSKKKERLDIFQSLCISLGYRSHLGDGCVYFNTEKGTTQIQFCHKCDNVKYKGKVYCLETEKGAFVLRRNGKVFISGNSGFPKSMNIGLAIDKKNGVDNRTGNIKTDGKGTDSGSGCYNMNNGDSNMKKEYEERKANNERAGWGTALKPSYEPIIVARKHLEGSCTDNVIKYGVGGINIDECRVETDDNLNGGAYSKGEYDTSDNVYKLGLKRIEGQYEQPQGRFPANTILTYDESDFEEVCGGFPDTKSQRTSGPLHDIRNGSLVGSGKTLDIEYERGYNDSGNASRYFYCAKASKRDRDEGLDEFEEKLPACMTDFRPTLATNPENWNNGMPVDNPMMRTKPRKNIHPTVKPTDLMQYLVRLVTPNGGTVLDPFNGSGSTGKAVMYENKDRNKNYKYIGIELTDEYLPISKARIEYVINKGIEKEKSDPKQEEQTKQRKELALF